MGGVEGFLLVPDRGSAAPVVDEDEDGLGAREVVGGVGDFWTEENARVLGLEEGGILGGLCLS